MAMDKSDWLLSTVEEAIEFVKRENSSEKPIVLSDFADNPGGGGYGDPLERDELLVARDLENGLSVVAAE